MPHTLLPVFLSFSRDLSAQNRLAIHWAVTFRIHCLLLRCASIAFVCLTTVLTRAAAPLSLHPENPHYFQYHGKALVLITSGEHYGAVLNLDFNYSKYLETLAGDGLNLTRTWAGAYCEPSSAFNIASNTLAPLPGKFIAPWARSGQPGYANGGNKFDLTKWNSAYFERLRDFMSQAGKKGIIVELNLFCPFYEESMWKLSPMNVINNINSLGDIGLTNVYTLDKSGPLLGIQENVVRKLVSELNQFDNFYYEICNEPYFGGVTLEWQHHIADVIREAERGKKQHLISRNVANDRAKVEHPHPAISIFNFHYATPPQTVAMNYGLNKVIGDNETGFRGTNDSAYRMEGWDFIVAGGGLFNNLDYSFVAGREDGTFIYPASQPGGGSSQLRRQYHFLAQTIHSLDFIHMQPRNELVAADLPEGVSVRTLANPGKAYLIYVRSGLEKQGKSSFADAEIKLRIQLPAGKYSAEWLDPKNIRRVSQNKLSATGPIEISAPAFVEDLALMIKR